MKDDGTFTPVEMGARSSGFICSHTVSLASGHDYMRDYINVLHGGRVGQDNTTGSISMMATATSSDMPYSQHHAKC